MKWLYMLLAFLLLTACGSSPALSDPQSAAGQVIQSAEDPYRKIFNAFESGEYAKAEELYQDKILGTLTTEGAALESIGAYTAALVEDYDCGLISDEDIQLIIDTMQHTSMWETLVDESFPYQIDTLRQSDQSYQNGLAAQERGEIAEALNAFLQVSSIDDVYPDAIASIIALARQAENSDDLETLRTAVLGIEKIKNIVFFEEDLEVSEDDYNYCLTGYRTLKTQYASALEDAGWIYHAIQQYAQLYSPDLARLLIWENKWDSPPLEDSAYHRLEADGSITQIGDTPWTLTGKAVQLMDGMYQYTPYMSRIYPSGELRVAVSASKTPDEIMDSFCQRLSGCYATSIIEASDQFAYLRLDGTVVIDRVDPTKDYDSDIEQISNWTNMVYVQSMAGGYIGLTESGHVYCTNYLREHIPVTSEWENIISLTTGYGLRAPYDMTRFILGLRSDGTIFSSVPLPDGSYWLDANAKALKGFLYLTQDGKLSSIFSEYAMLLDELYSDYSFTRLTTCNPGENDSIVAETTDGDFLLLDFDYLGNLESYWI